MDNITQRDAFWNTIYDMARMNRNIVVVSADMGAPALDKFREDLPGQFFNVGIAEQNGVLIAAGLAMTGKRPFVYAIAPFVTLRCIEQIRVESCIMNIPITLVGVGAGFGYEDSGPTHHIIEDIAMIRAMPNIIINSITDNAMAEAVASMSCSMESSNYVRLDRQPLPDVYSPGTDFKDGVARLRPGNDACIIATGCMVHIALAVADTLHEKGIEAGVLDLYTFPVNESLLLKMLGNVRRIITLEEHFLPGGLGSAVCEVLVDANISIPVKRIGLSTEQAYCYEYGGREIIRGYYGIHRDGILDQVMPAEVQDTIHA